MNKYFMVAGVLAIAFLSFFAGTIFNSAIGPAGLSAPFLTNITPTAHTCIDQKCVAVNNQCSTDSNCETHTQCSNQKCVVVSGAGTSQCSVDQDCLVIKDPQKWCELNNPGAGLKVNAIKYPNGNFSCDCYYINADGNHAQASCHNSHLQ